MVYFSPHMNKPSMPGKFEILATDAHSRARVGRLWTAHGPVETPVFMPVGTQATVKALEPRDLVENNAEIILANTYHLGLRPGMDVIANAGGLHRFMNWQRPYVETPMLDGMDWILEYRFSGEPDRMLSGSGEGPANIQEFVFALDPVNVREERLVI